MQCCPCGTIIWIIEYFINYFHHILIKYSSNIYQKPYCRVVRVVQSIQTLSHLNVHIWNPDRWSMKYWIQCKCNCVHVSGYCTIFFKTNFHVLTELFVHGCGNVVSMLGGKSFWAELEKLQKVSKSNQVQQGLQNCLGELALKSFLPFSFQNLKRFKIKIWDLRFEI